MNSGGFALRLCGARGDGGQGGPTEATVWAIDGDGCFQMTNQELATCAIEGIPIKVAVINNASLGMVRQWQTLFYNERYSNTDLPAHPRLRQAGRGLRLSGPAVDTAADVDATIEKAMAVDDRPVVIDFGVHRDAMVWPMVPAGTGNDDIQIARHGAGLRDREGLRPTMSKHTLSVLVENKPGVLARIAALFSRRGFNIDSLAVGPTEHPPVSRMTVVVDVEDQPLEQVTKQLNKLVNVIKIVELMPPVGATRAAPAQGEGGPRVPIAVLEITVLPCQGRRRRSRCSDDRGDRLPDKRDALLRVLEPFVIRELVQSGVVAVGRGSRSITDRTLRPLDRTA